MLNARSTNQRARRRSRRNRRQPPPPANQIPPKQIDFAPKTKYANSTTNANGVFILSARKRRLPTPEEIEAKKRKKFNIQSAEVSLIALRHTVVNLWKYGIHTADFQFDPGSSKKIIQWMQATQGPAYEKFDCAKSFFYRALTRHKKSHEQPNLEAYRDRRGENRRKTKRNDPRIIQLCDELLSEPKANAPKVKRQLHQHGVIVSVSTIKRIGRDLHFRWTKPWYTDVLTPAQKLKRYLFCAQLLRLTEEALLRRIAEWMWTDEKWWDLVGPACCEYVKADTAKDAKMQVQVSSFLFCFAQFFIIYFCLIAFLLYFRLRVTKARKVE